jgi:hypothetical protein
MQTRPLTSELSPFFNAHFIKICTEILRTESSLRVEAFKSFLTNRFPYLTERSNTDFTTIWQLLVIANVVPSSLILSALIIEVMIPPIRLFFQEPRVLTSQNTAV